MDRRIFIAGLTVWTALLLVGGYWISRPWLGAPREDFKQITRAETEKVFAIRLASLANSGGSLGSYAQRIDEEDSSPPPKFDYGDWMWRECRNRFVAFFVIWIVCGFLIHWLIARIFEGKTELGDPASC